MARMAVEDGIRIMACTPHRTPGLYDTSAEQIRTSVAVLRQRLTDEGIDLTICCGSDVHVSPDLPKLLAEGPEYRLARSRYFLFEPPHQFLPPRLIELVERVKKSGFRPILTHPERLRWVAGHYDVFEGLIRAGCLVQLTAGSVTGRFGSEARDLSLRMLEEGKVDILATDAHNLTSRPPRLSEAVEIVSRLLGESEARRMTVERPAHILKDRDLSAVGLANLDRAPVGNAAPAPLAKRFWERLRR